MRLALRSACAALLAIAAAASADATSDYNTGLALGTQAYQYGVPLLDTAAHLQVQHERHASATT